MKFLSHKLRSNAGASMILALVFMLFCMFIGGTVLAAASANGYRVAHLSDQQQYLDERSAAYLTAEELRLSGSFVSTHMLTINDVTQKVQEVTVGNGGVVTPVGEPTTSRLITFQAPAGLIMTPFQRIMYETAVLRYIQENSIDVATVPIRLDNFVYNYNNTDATITSVAEFWCAGVKGSLTVNGTTDSGNKTFTNFPANYECLTGSGLYDFVVDFGDYSQMSIILKASLGEREPVEQVTIDDWTEGGRTYSAQITTTSRMPVIMWESATIVKGGA